VHQLRFPDILGDVLATTDVTTVMMPYASAVFSRRIPEDRPRLRPIRRRQGDPPDLPRAPRSGVLPDCAGNFAFLGQSTDLPEDVVFTVEYSVRGAMHAIVGLKALESAFR
jgi:oleate hydratase